MNLYQFKNVIKSHVIFMVISMKKAKTVALTFALSVLATLGVSSAQAQALKITCASEDEGSLTAVVPPSAFTYDSQNALASVSNLVIGNLRNGEIQVRLNAELYGKGRSVRFQPLEIVFIPTDPANVVGARVGQVWQRKFGVGVTAIGPGIDPEGIDCSVKAKMPL
jgi:hypothetical protein